jgi:hypothetical protein
MGHRSRNLRDFTAFGIACLFYIDPITYDNQTVKYLNLVVLIKNKSHETP